MMKHEGSNARNYYDGKGLIELFNPLVPGGKRQKRDACASAWEKGIDQEES